MSINAQTIVDFISAHAGWTAVLIFLVSFGESFAFISFFFLNVWTILRLKFRAGSWFWKSIAIYVGGSFPDPAGKRGELRGIVIGNAKDGSLKAFIPDPADLDKGNVGTSSSGIAADDAGSIYSADVAAHNLRKYIKIK